MAMAGKNSLKQIAEKTGLAISTVSQILNGRAYNYSSESTKLRVIQAAQELGYQTNFGYKLMKGLKTKTVAILNSMPQMNTEEYVLELIMRMISEFDQLGYSAYCSTFSNDPEKNLEKIRTLIGRGVEHFVLLGCPYGHEAIINEIEKNELSLISNSGNFERWVSNGAVYGATAIFRHLKEQTGDNFKLICQAKDVVSDCSRLQSLQQVFPHLTLEQIIADFVFSFPDIEFEVEDYLRLAGQKSYNATRELLRQFPKIGAIAYMNDVFAIGGGCCLLENGNEHFRKILLYGFNNDHTVWNFPLPISSVGFCLGKQAELLVRHALLKTPCREIVYPKLHVRTVNSGPAYPHWDETIINCTPQEEKSQLK